LFDGVCVFFSAGFWEQQGLKQTFIVKEEAVKLWHWTSRLEVLIIKKKS